MEKEQKNMIDKKLSCLMWNKSHPANMPNTMGYLSLKAVAEIAFLFTPKTVKIGVFIRYNYTASHLRSFKNYM